jgi:hypothetical protein
MQSMTSNDIGSRYPFAEAQYDYSTRVFICNGNSHNVVLRSYPSDHIVLDMSNCSSHKTISVKPPLLVYDILLRAQFPPYILLQQVNSFICCSSSIFAQFPICKYLPHPLVIAVATMRVLCMSFVCFVDFLMCRCRFP